MLVVQLYRDGGACCISPELPFRSYRFTVSSVLLDSYRPKSGTDLECDEHGTMADMTSLFDMRSDTTLKRPEEIAGFSYHYC